MSAIDLSPPESKIGVPSCSPFWRNMSATARCRLPLGFSTTSWCSAAN
jgi:hypothetical protein